MPITNRDLYDAINDLRREISGEIKDLRVEVDANTTWRHEIMGKLTVVFFIIGISVNFIWDYFMNKLKG